MKILVTGVAGFFGSNLAEYLLNKGHQVLGIDNFNDYYSPKIKRYNIKDFEHHPNFKLYELDITGGGDATLDSSLELGMTGVEVMFKKEQEIDAIIHLAAWAGVTRSFDIPAVYVRNNIEGTVNLIDLAVKYKIPNFIFASTSSVYGKNPTPFREDMSADTPLAPYPATKRACEIMLKTYSINYDINVTVFRIFNPQAPRMRPDLALPKMIKSCLYGTEFPVYWSGMDPKRDYCYIGHMFEAIDSILEKPFKYEIFNLGNSSPVGLNELMDIVEDVVGKKINKKIMPERKGEMEVTYADIEKARKLLHYDPKTSLRECVSIYYEWFKKQDDWYKSS